MVGEDFVVELLFFLERNSRLSSCKTKELHTIILLIWK